MFSFGIFASHTPFLIMAGLYLFYMLVNFGAKFNQEAVDDATTDEKVINRETAVAPAEDDTLLSLSAEDFQKTNTDDALQEAETEYPPFYGLMLKIYLYRDHCVRRVTSFYLFERPPPLQA